MVRCGLYVLVLLSSVVGTAAEKGYELERRKVSGTDREAVYETYLKFPGRPAIRLGPTRQATTAKTSSDDCYGLDPETISVTRHPGTDFVSISWSTYGHGSGHYIHAGCLLVELIPNDAIVLFRDVRHAYSRCGWESASGSKLAFETDGKRVTMVEEENCRFADTKPRPGYVKAGKTDDGVTVYRLSYTLIRRWEYTVENHHLTFAKGSMGLKLDGEYPRKELSEALKLTIPGEAEAVTGSAPVADYLGPYVPQGASPYGGGK